MDPFETFVDKDFYGYFLQKVSWLMQSMGELMKNHLKILAEFPPVQAGKSFDMSNVVQEFMNKSVQ